jgi:hypothetical protein
MAGSSQLASAAGPVFIPTRASGYLAAQAWNNSQSYQVTLNNTTQPVGLNSPNLTNVESAEPAVASFGLIELSVSLPAQGSPGYLTTLQTHNYNEMTLSPTKGRPAALGRKIWFSIYRRPRHVTDWQEGNWTLQVSGGSVSQEIPVVQRVVTYLHTHALPPAPGIVAIRVVPGSGATTMIEWVKGRQLMWVGVPRATVHNPGSTCAMAVSWRLVP